MKSERLLVMGLVVMFLLIGCGGKTIVQMDGMPIPNFEYVAQDEETGVKASYILTRYHKQYEGNEFLIVPEYLNAWDDNEIDSTDTERLILHVRVVNLKRIEYNVWYEFQSADGSHMSYRNLYHGRLSRKDFSVDLPITAGLSAKYRIAIDEHGGDTIHEIGFPSFSYTTEGGATPQKHNGNLYHIR